jgi:hypothetical protein
MAIRKIQCHLQHKFLSTIRIGDKVELLENDDFSSINQNNRLNISKCVNLIKSTSVNFELI